jgi:putative spermidine/putrescine transport system ATP-binding protein
VQLEVGTTTLFVTHDQEEALAIADRVGVMQAGRLEQLAAPTEVYAQPATAFVAEFVGLTNRVPAVVDDGAARVLGVRVPLVDPTTAPGPVTALVRPEALGVDADDAAAAGPLTGTVVANSFLGAVSRVSVDVGEAGTLVAQLPTAEAARHAVGTRVRLTLRPDPVLVTARDAVAPVEEEQA